MRDITVATRSRSDCGAGMGWKLGKESSEGVRREPESVDEAEELRESFSSDADFRGGRG